MPDLMDVLRDRATYGDDLTMDLNGVKVTLKDLRDGLIPKGDFTRVTQQAAERERQLQAAVDGYQRQLAEALQARQATGQVPTGGVTKEDLLHDPVLGPIVQNLDTVMEQQRGVLERLQMHEQGYLRDQYAAKLAGFRFTDGQDRENFLKHMVEHKLVDMDLGYRDYTRTRELAAATKAAREEGMEAARREARAIPIPTGARRAAAAKPEGPTSLHDPSLMDHVERDPDILAALRGEAPE